MKIKFNRFAQARSFRSHEDFARFAEKQAKSFGELEQSNTNAFQWWARAMSVHWKSAADAANLPEGAEEALTSSIQQRPLILIDSPVSIIGQELGLSGKRRAAEQVIPFLTGSSDGQHGGSLLVEALDARARMMAAISLETTIRRGNRSASFDAFVRDHEDRLSDMLEADREEISERRAQFNLLIEDATKRFNKLRTQAHDGIISAKGEWTATHQSFVDDLKLETAVDLWNSRANTHTARYESFRKVAVWSGAIGLLAVLAWIFLGFLAARAAIPQSETGQVAAYAAGSIAVFTLYVWGLRVMIRSMISEDHLATDASARSALAHTYMALTKVERASQEDRAIVLATLFAPVSDGLVKDDGMPTMSPTAWAAQMITKP